MKLPYDNKLFINNGYRILLATFMVMLLVSPILIRFVAIEWLITLLVYSSFVVGLLIISHNTGHFRSLLFLVVCAFCFDVSRYFTSSIFLMFMSFLIDVILYAYLASLILNDIIFKQKKVTVDMIAGAVCVYILIGILFAHIYILIQYLEPESFAGVKFINEGSPADSIPGFLYFSFVTLTTLGYGDISPNTIEAGSFVYMETIIGQVYMTVLVARLVGMHIAQSDK